MRKTVKTLIAALLAVTLCIGISVPAFATSGYMIPDSDEIYINSDEVYYLGIDCYGDYDYINYSSYTNGCTCEFIEWSGDYAIFCITPATALGEYAEGELTFRLIDKYGYTLSTETVLVEIIPHTFDTSVRKINLAANGSGEMVITCLVTAKITGNFHMNYESLEKIAGNAYSATWGEWYKIGDYQCIDLYLKINGKYDAFDILEISMKNDYGYSYDTEFAYINLMSEYYNPLPYGDTDSDGKITVSDARLCLRAAIGLEYVDYESELFPEYDVDKDYEITVLDARLILRESIGIHEVDYTEYERLLDSYFSRYCYGDFTTIDLDGNGYPELIIQLGFGMCEVYTVDSYGYVTYCGWISDIIYEKNGNYYTVYDNEVYQLTLNSGMAIVETECNPSVISSAERIEFVFASDEAYEEAVEEYYQ